jgi:hypothetical protein
MTTYDIPDSLAARLPERSVCRFRTYSPVSMSPELWERSRPALLSLLADTEPRNDADARKVMGAICAFYAWAAARFGNESIPALFTEARVNAFDTSRVATATPGTRLNDLGRLKRCLRVMQGEPPVTRRSAREYSVVPYRSDEVAALIQAAASNHGLARALAVGLVTGRAGANCTEAPVPAYSALADVLERLGVEEAAGLPVALEGHEIASSGTWQRARGEARRAGLELDAGRLHMTWLAAVTAEPRMVGDLVDLGLSRRDLDMALVHARPATPEQCRTLLRG